MANWGRLPSRALFGAGAAPLICSAGRVFGPYRIGPIEDTHELDQNGDGLLGRFVSWFDPTDTSQYVRVKEQRRMWDLLRRLVTKLKQRDRKSVV